MVMETLTILMLLVHVFTVMQVPTLFSPNQDSASHAPQVMFVESTL